MTVHVTGLGTYLPPQILTGAEVAEMSGLPEVVVVEKMGVREKRVCHPDDDHPSEMCVEAAIAALADAGRATGAGRSAASGTPPESRTPPESGAPADPAQSEPTDAPADASPSTNHRSSADASPSTSQRTSADASPSTASAQENEPQSAGTTDDPSAVVGQPCPMTSDTVTPLPAASLDAIRYHGSEYKDYPVWNLAAAVADSLGADGATAAESYALCAGFPIALRGARALLSTEHGHEKLLLVAASREEDLVDYDDPTTSFMFNFGSGATAMVLERDAPERAIARVCASASLTDGSFAEDVVTPAGGTRHPPSHETVENGQHSLRVPDQATMKRRLGEVSLPNFLTVADEALDRSGYDRADVDFAAITHMKRSFHETLCAELGLASDEQHYLDTVGHVQSCDQGLALDAARDRLTDGDVVLCLAAGTGYTWAASVLEWREQHT